MTVLIQAARNVLEQKKGLKWNYREEIETEVRVRISGVFQSMCQTIDFLDAWIWPLDLLLQKAEMKHK